MLAPPFIFDAPRDTIRFLDPLSHYDAFRKTAAELERKGCHDIGLDSNTCQFDYPLFVLLGAPQGRGRLRFVGVQTCAVVYLSCSKDPQSTTRYGAPMPRVAAFEGVSLFAP